MYSTSDATCCVCRVAAFSSACAVRAQQPADQQQNRILKIVFNISLAQSSSRTSGGRRDRHLGSQTSQTPSCVIPRSDRVGLSRCCFRRIVRLRPDMSRLLPPAGARAPAVAFSRVLGFIPAVLDRGFQTNRQLPPTRPPCSTSALSLAGNCFSARGRHEELSAYRALASLRTDRLWLPSGRGPGRLSYHHFMLAVVGSDRPERATPRSAISGFRRFSFGTTCADEAKPSCFHQGPPTHNDADPAHSTAESYAPGSLGCRRKTFDRRIVPDDAAPGVVIAISHDEQAVIARRVGGSLRYVFASVSPAARAQVNWQTLGHRHNRQRWRQRAFRPSRMDKRSCCFPDPAVRC